MIDRVRITILYQILSIAFEADAGMQSRITELPNKLTSEIDQCDPEVSEDTCKLRKGWGLSGSGNSHLNH